MNRRRTLACLAGLGATGLGAPGWAAAQPAPLPPANAPAAELIAASLRLEKLPHWRARSTLTVKDGARTRVRSGEVLVRVVRGANSDRVYRFQVPADIAGTAFLVRENPPGDDDMWMYLPGLGKVRRIIASSKRDAFMASDFSYADLMSLRVDDFEHRALPQEACADGSCHVIESRPKSAAVRDNMGFARLLTHLRTDNLLTQRLRYFDDQGTEFKSQTVHDYRAFGSHQIAARREMTQLRTGRVSVLLLEDLRSDPSLPASVFSETGLAP